MKGVLFSLLLTFALSKSDDEYACPPRENIAPCSCKIGTDKNPWVSCDGITSEKELEKAMEGLEDYKLSTFILTKSNIGVLPSNIFSDVEIHSLNILYTNISSISESLNRPPFIGLENSLQSLEIKDAFVNEESPLTRLSLSHLKKLTFLQLEGNLMPTIGNDWFESGPYGLRQLHLMDTSAKVVGSHAFIFLTELRQVSVTGGSISEISRNMFPIPAIHLEMIDFSDNQLAVLPKNLFSKMPSLAEIFLENNDLTSLDEVVFSQVWSQVSYAFFYGNPFNCDKEMKWIYKYRLPESLQGHCITPQQLQYRSLRNLTLSDFE